MSLRDNFKTKQEVFIQSPIESYTLNDLRNDDEFNEKTTRFLQSIGEGKTADDLFGYFRGMEYNLGDAAQAMFQTKKFDDQQKDDYLYLKNKFNNANVGDWVEWARTSADIGQEILTDPTMIASALFIPWTGGTSLAARLSAGKAVQTGLKVAANKTVQEGTKKGFAAMPGQVLKKPLTPIQTHALVGTEGMLYGSSYDFLRQNREINVGQREDYNLEETLTTGALGGVLGYGASFGIRHIANTPSYLRSIEERRLTKIDHNESYKDNVLEKINQAALYSMTLFTKPTSSFLLKAKKSKTLSDLIKVFRYDAEKPILAEAAGTTPRMKESYNETLNEFIGTRLEGLKDILNKYNLYELGQRDIVGSFRKKTLLKSYRLSEKTNNDLTKYLRTGNKKGLDDNLVKAGDEVKRLLNEILEQARKEGLNVGKVENFFPRVWLLDSMKNNKAAFINQIRKDEKLSVAKATELWKRMTNLNEVDGTSAANLASIRAKRKLLNIDDSKYSQFLDNNVENVLQDYIFQAGKLITRKKLFGENLEEFRNKFVNKIDDELGGIGLGKVERDKLENLYLFTTGQRGYINNPVGRFLSDTIAVTTQTSLLPFAAITSLSEIGVPLLKGANTKEYAKAVWKGLAESADEWWNGVQTAFGREGAKSEGRSLNRRELNAFNRSVDMAREDRATAIYGQAMGRTATKIQNVFFKSIFLHDWTRFVQLVSYDTGKGIIYRNLDELANKQLNKKTTARLTDELNELGVDINKGIQWIKKGANHTDDFYMQDVRRGAARYTDEVIMNPTVASNQKPLIHSHPATKWSFGLLGFPTAFSNTVLKNAVREISKDLSNTNRLATPKVLSGILVMTAAGLVGNSLRTGGRNLQEYREGEKPLVSSLTARAEGKETGLINDALVRTGLYGPFEYYVRTQEAQRYQNNVTALLTSLTGPAVGDVLDYVRASQYRGATLEAIFKKAPFITVLRSQFPETYKESLQTIRELDKEAGPQRPSKEVIPFATGGLVSGPKVPYTQEDPADRINPMTGQPYQEQMSRLGFAEGRPNRATRNNNPFNLVYGPAIGAKDIPWEGKITHNPKVEDTFEVFKNPVMGFRAGIKNTMTQFNRGNNTVEKLIKIHAPKKGDIIKDKDENPYQDNFINFTSKNLNVRPDEEINLNDPKVMKEYVRSVATFEGFETIKEEDITKALSLVEAAKFSSLGSSIEQQTQNN